MLKSKMSGDVVDLVYGSCANFKRFLRRSYTLHVRQVMVERVHTISEQGKPGRKDLIGVTAFLDEHAIFYASSKKHIEEFPNTQFKT